MNFDNYFVVGIKLDGNGKRQSVTVEQHTTYDYANAATGWMRFDEGLDRTYIYGGTKLVWDKEQKKHVVPKG